MHRAKVRLSSRCCSLEVLARLYCSAALVVDPSLAAVEARWHCVAQEHKRPGLGAAAAKPHVAEWRTGALQVDQHGDCLVARFLLEKMVAT